MIPIENAITTKENTRILDSCMVKSKVEMREFLEKLREQNTSEMAVCQRDMESMIREWRSHNFFYALHVFRSRTQDVDLELKQTWYRELFCFAVSCFYDFIDFLSSCFQKVIRLFKFKRSSPSKVD